VIVAFAGHGLQFEKEKDAFFCPRDARPFADATDSLVSLGKLYASLEQCFASVKVLLVDACRDDPDRGRGTRGVDADNAPRPPSGVAALFSCRAGERAYEHAKYKHGVFFHHLLQGLKGEAPNSKGRITFAALAEYVQDQVSADVPKLIGDGARQSTNVKMDQSGPALTLIAKAAKVDSTPAPIVVPSGAELDLGGGEKIKFVRLPKGTAWLGGGSAEGAPKKQVPIDYDVQLAVYTVTQGQWQQVMGHNPSYFSRQRKGDFSGQGEGSKDVEGVSDANLKRFPVESVSWNDVQKFLEKLNGQQNGKGWKYRLPKEAEWEYGCRNAAQTEAECSLDFYFAKGTNDLSAGDANFLCEDPAGNGTKGAPLRRTTIVGSYKPNALGLYDMHGNVWQWCEELYDNTASLRVIRGGCWRVNGRVCRAANRDHDAPTLRSSVLGFRLARVPSGQ
jgi:formylglycine-generating enzyme required for sulfatase activity